MCVCKGNLKKSKNRIISLTILKLVRQNSVK